MEEPVLPTVEAKLNELISLLESANLDHSSRKMIQKKLNTALKLYDPTLTGGDSDHLQQFFSGHKTDERKARTNRVARSFISIVRIITALLMVCLGFGMIVMPAPDYFEMFTLFTIPGSNGNDGVTIMDLISLIVAFAGISLFISAVIKFNK